MSLPFSTSDGSDTGLEIILLLHYIGRNLSTPLASLDQFELTGSTTRTIQRFDFMLREPHIIHHYMLLDHFNLHTTRVINSPLASMLLQKRIRTYGAYLASKSPTWNKQKRIRSDHVSRTRPKAPSIPYESMPYCNMTLTRINNCSMHSIECRHPAAS